MGAALTDQAEFHKANSYCSLQLSYVPKALTHISYTLAGPGSLGGESISSILVSMLASWRQAPTAAERLSFASAESCKPEPTRVMQRPNDPRLLV